MTNLFCVQIKLYETNEVMSTKAKEGKPLRYCEKLQRGIDINLDDAFYSEIVKVKQFATEEEEEETWDNHLSFLEE